MGGWQVREGEGYGGWAGWLTGSYHNCLNFIYIFLWVAQVQDSVI